MRDIGIWQNDDDSLFSLQITERLRKREDSDELSSTTKTISWCFCSVISWGLSCFAFSHFVLLEVYEEIRLRYTASALQSHSSPYWRNGFFTTYAWKKEKPKKISKWWNEIKPRKYTLRSLSKKYLSQDCLTEFKVSGRICLRTELIFKLSFWKMMEEIKEKVNLKLCNNHVKRRANMDLILWQSVTVIVKASTYVVKSQNTK